MQRILLPLVLLTALAACQSNGGRAVVDEDPQATLGDTIAEPTDGFDNEPGIGD
ncbi:lipoprotein [Palleronia sp. LCG004]|uniref:lipoprotein n=1 Tax=Palleronia sp. LCG004 TaxID=3079304 RepID=UPI0029422FE0|nr:lipoprotein [Palleronia sp. LCG004]WOI55300.1 lipoprotein [Palleronia sp. LCG004]